MAKGRGRTTHAHIIAEFARRRGGGNYFYAMQAARSGLVTLGADYDDAPRSYKAYLAAGICTAIECHMKYAFAHAAERFSSNHKVLVRLFQGVEVDVETLISMTSRVFTLADVAAANVSISSMEAYQNRASELLSKLSGREFEVPWSYDATSFEKDAKKEVADRWERLRQVFELRHRLIHEVVSDAEVDAVLGMNADTLVDDACWFLEIFEDTYWGLELDAAFGVKEREILIPEGVDRLEKELDSQLDALKAGCERRELKAFRKFEKALKAYIWSRSAFEASVYAGMQSEETASVFVELVPQYAQTLNEISSRHRFVHDTYPYEQQLKDMGIEFVDPTEKKPKTKTSAKRAKRSPTS